MKEFSLLTRSMAIAVVVLFVTLGYMQTATAQQPVGKPLKQDIPQTKVDPAAKGAIMTEKMLGNIKITRLTVQDPQPQCVGEWHATVLNPNNTELTFGVEIYQFDSESGQWHQVGVAKSVKLAKDEQRSLNGQWERRMHAQKLKLSVRRAHTVYKEHEITLPALPAPNVEITGIDIADTGYTVHIKNKGAASQCFLGRQCYKMVAQAGPTTGGLGGVPIKVPGNSTITSHNSLAADWKTGVNFIKCDIRNFGNDTVVTTKIVPLSQ